MRCVTGSDDGYVDSLGEPARTRPRNERGSVGNARRVVALLPDVGPITLGLRFGGS